MVKWSSEFQNKCLVNFIGWDFGLHHHTELINNLNDVFNRKELKNLFYF